MDEARFGLKPTYRRRWSRKGKRPTAPSRARYEWTYLYGVVHPDTGELFWLVLPRVGIAVMNVFLHEYASSLPEDVVAVMVLDGAGWHTSGQLTVPPNIQLALLPPYTPELNPAERLWHFVREATSNRTFATLDELETILCERCLQLDAQPQLLASATAYHGYGYHKPTGAQP